MKLKKLLKNLPITHVVGSKEIDITGICAHSKFVSPGNLFIARRGLQLSGNQFIEEAVNAGAAAILTDRADPMLRGVTQLIYPDVKALEPLVAEIYYQSPADSLKTIGITGTNGKTTTSFLTKHLLDHAFGLCGLIGTIEYIIGHSRYQATHTTPDVCSNHKMLREMIVKGCKAAILEVTSHALEQQRVERIAFDIALLTNITPEHLDYHGSFEVYCETKKKLFSSLDPSLSKFRSHSPYAIINSDDPQSAQLSKACRGSVVTYGIDNKAALWTSDLVFETDKTRFMVHWQGYKLPCFVPLLGRFNVYNALGALAIALCCGVDLHVAAELLSTSPSVPGRLEKVANSLNIDLYIDFCHTEDALTKVLTALRPQCQGRLIVVFGCGGERDTVKRPKMARAAERLADLIIVTTDNPRREDPSAIIGEIISGFESKSSHQVIADRKEAICNAIESAAPGDTILIAGRGHESHQIWGQRSFPFDDRQISFQACCDIAAKRLTESYHRNAII